MKMANAFKFWNANTNAVTWPSPISWIPKWMYCATIRVIKIWFTKSACDDSRPNRPAPFDSTIDLRILFAVLEIRGHLQSRPLRPLVRLIGNYNVDSKDDFRCHVSNCNYCRSPGVNLSRRLREGPERRGTHRAASVSGEGHHRRSAVGPNLHRLPGDAQITQLFHPAAAGGWRSNQGLRSLGSARAGRQSDPAD